MRLTRGSAAVAAIGAAAVALSGCGSSRHHVTTTGTPANTVPSSPAGTLKINPGRPSTRSTIAFGFTVPIASGVQGGHVIDYSLSVTGTGRPGCVGAQEAAAPAAAKGGTTTIRLGPAQLRRPWCPGHYQARVIELQRAHCTGQSPCPQYVRVVAIIARGSFSVSRA